MYETNVVGDGDVEDKRSESRSRDCCSNLNINNEYTVKNV